MPYSRPDFNGALLNFRLILKLGAPSRLGARGPVRLLGLYVGCVQLRIHDT